MKFTEKQQGIAIIAVLAIFLTIAFATLPLPYPDDWNTFSNISRRLLNNTPLYDSPVAYEDDYFFYPPWLAVLLLPISLIPLRWGYAIISVATLGVLALLAKHYKLSPLKLGALIASPPTFYILIHGQIDILVLGGVLLPAIWWPLVALTKPQVTIALALGVKRKDWVKSGILFFGVVGISFLLFGLWPLKIMEHSNPLLFVGRNLWSGLSPLQMVAGLGLAFLAMNRDDERFLIASSPFFSPYVATSSMLGPVMVAATFLKDWQTIVLVLAWWGVIVSRLLV